MSATGLTKREKKKALAALKKGKRKVKNILAPPELHKFSDPKIYSKCIPQISELLKRLLPAAKLQSSPSKPDVKDSPEKLSLENISKRVQLLLGINVVSKGVANGTAACIFFADDIQPKLLIHHLIVLCTQREIPYVYIPKFRELTKQTLGFSCIVLGIKSNSTDFLPVVNLIRSLVVAKKCEENTPGETEVNEDITIVENEEKEKERKEISFQYLYRDSDTKRTFVPDGDNEKMNGVSQSNDFIVLKNDDMDTEIVYEKGHSNEFGNILGSLRDPEDLLTNLVKEGNKSKSKKRKRKISQTGNKREVTSVKYAPAKVIKMEANPSRQKRKFDKQKILPDKTLNIAATSYLKFERTPLVRLPNP